jgi:4-hydroxy-tetrahydrodipicolinate reductase
VIPIRKPRIVIYGPGLYGQHIVRFADKKGWPIVAAFNRAGEKVGQDLGRVAGLGKDIGVVVQDCDTANYDDLHADVAFVVISDRLEENRIANARMLNAGINVISHASEGYFPWGIDQRLADELDSLARQNGVTFTGTGIWDLSRIWAGIMVAGPCVEIDGLVHRTLTDASRASVRLMTQTCGVGMSQAEYHERIVQQPGLIGGLYKSIPEHVLTALGYTPTAVSERREPVLFDEPIYCAPLDRHLEAGVSVGTRIIASVQTAEGVSAEAHMELRLMKPGEKEHMLWTVHGLPSTTIITQREDSVLASAAAMFNRAYDVIAAPPGIQEVYKLGPLKHTALDTRAAI